MNAAPVVALFCGSREWTDRERIRRDLESLPRGSPVGLARRSLRSLPLASLGSRSPPGIAASSATGSPVGLAHGRFAP